MEGLCFGFRLGFDHGRMVCVRARGNMASTRQGSNLISSYLDEERSLGRVIGPLDIEAFPMVHNWSDSEGFIGEVAADCGSVLPRG